MVDGSDGEGDGEDIPRGRDGRDRAPVRGLCGMAEGEDGRER